MKKLIYVFCLLLFIFSCKQAKIESTNIKELDIYPHDDSFELMRCSLVCNYKDDEIILLPNEKLEKTRSEYTMSVPYSATNIKLDVKTNNKNANIVILSKEPKTLETVKDSIQVINFLAISSDGSSRSYVVKAIRQEINSDKSLCLVDISFSLNGKTQSLTITENLDATPIEAHIPFLAKNVKVRAITVSPATTIEITKNQNELALSEGSKQDFDIKVIAEDDSEKTFKLECVRDGKSNNAYLKELFLIVDGKSVELSPKFSKTTLEYTAKVPCFASSLKLEGTPESFSSSISEIKYNPLNFKTTEGEKQKIFIKVLAEDDSSLTYTITAIRDSLSGDNTLDYVILNGKRIECNSEFNEVTLPYKEINIELFATARHSSAKVYILPNSKLLLHHGKNKIEILVVAENKRERRYWLNINILPPEIEMVKIVVPSSGITFPKGKLDENTELIIDDGDGIITNSFEIANYELNYMQWYEVYMWAIQNGYVFDRAGVAGSHGAKEIVEALDKPLKPAPIEEATKYHPVTQVTWRDVIVWCNALNEKEGLPLVYYYDGEPLKSSIMPTKETQGQEKPDYACDEAEVRDEGGYRLPTEVEWEFAARLTGNKINTVPNKTCLLNGLEMYFTKGDSASGAFLSCKDVKKDYNSEYILTGAIETKKFAVFKWFFNGKTNAENKDVNGTQAIGTKEPNFMNIYDMTGNVEEFCFDNDYSIYRARRGGSWASGPKNLQIGLHESNVPGFGSYTTGFRLARTIK